MQKDYMAMAQQQGVNAQQPPTPGVEQPLTQEDRQQTAQALKQMPTMEKMGAAGLPTGGSKQDMKARILAVLEELGLMQLFNTPDKKQELAKNIDDLVTALESNDAEAIESNPIVVLMSDMQQQQPQQQQDFASMAGGGMGGR